MNAVDRRAHHVARAFLCTLIVLFIVAAADVVPAQAGGGSTVATMLKHVNALRARLGLGPVVPDPRLMRAAQRQSEVLAIMGVLTHTPPAGDLGSRVHRVGYDYWLVEENLASGLADPAKVVRAWLGSPGHRANLLRAEVSTIGIGYVQSGRALGNYWTIILAKPSI
jgi:uncharacterized protein YkwD